MQWEQAEQRNLEQTEIDMPLAPIRSACHTKLLSMTMLVKGHSLSRSRLPTRVKRTGHSVRMDTTLHAFDQGQAPISELNRRAHKS